MEKSTYPPSGRELPREAIQRENKKCRKSKKQEEDCDDEMVVFEIATTMTALAA
jgi:hypothetical protein